MSQQVEYFSLIKETLISQLGEDDTRLLLGDSLYIVVLGSNDFINNYMLPGAASRLMYTFQSWGDLLVKVYCQHIKVLITIFNHLMKSLQQEAF